MYSILTTTILLSLTSAFVIPFPKQQQQEDQSSTQTLSSRSITPLDQLLSIVPQASTCASSPVASECATASTVLSPIIASFAKYSINTAAEQAALLSWMAFESAEFKYNQNHFPAPGRPGQGTRNMMMPNYVKEYALSIPDLASKVSGKSDADVLALVQGDEYSFGSTAWFYSVHCGEQIKAGVRTGTQSGWEGFITGCVGTTVDQGSGAQSRVAYWQRAAKALYVTS